MAICPTRRPPTGAGGGPAWSGYCITLPWEVYLRYGDRRILLENFPTAQRWLAFLETKAQDNLLVRWGGEWDFLGDWLWPGAKGVNGDTPETLFFNNCYWIYNLQTAARIARVLGQTSQADQYQQRAEAVARAVQAKFYRASEHSYVNGFQAYLALALLVNLPSADQQPGSGSSWPTKSSSVARAISMRGLRAARSCSKRSWRNRETI